MEQLAKATLIEGIASTSARDVQGESLDLEGADISPLLEGRGFVNSDHSQKFEHLVGRVIDAKKIYDLKDCETPTQVKYWSEHKKPFIWSKMELWDGVGHKEADSIGAIYKHYQNKNEEPPIKLSVEGKTLERGPNGLLKRTLIRGIAITVAPANRETKTDVVGILKSVGGDETLIKSETDHVPLFVESDADDDALSRIYDLAVYARELIKNARTLREELVIDSISKLKSVEALDRYRKIKALA